jgi:hypothetical protein
MEQNLINTNSTVAAGEQEMSHELSQPYTPMEKVLDEVAEDDSSVSSQRSRNKSSLKRSFINFVPLS